ncbi:MAG: bacillithiol biosynthesis protein BshC [Candidatus Hodarchaeales archaeon]
MQLLTVYQKVSERTANKSESDLAVELWGNIPRNFEHLTRLLPSVSETTGLLDKEDNLTTLARIVEDTHRKLGTYSSIIRSTAGNLSCNLIEVGHQPLFYGGGSFLFNKVSATASISSYSKKHGVELLPLFFIGDHDGVQNELTIARFPQVTSPKGLTIQYKIDSHHAHSPIHSIKAPGEKQLREWNAKIRNNYLELLRFAKIKNHFRPLLMERLDNYLGMVLESRVKHESFSWWIMGLWSDILTMKNELPLMFLPSSNMDLRRMMLPVFEELTSEKNRKKFVKTLNDVRYKLIDGGFHPGLPEREPESYSPFFIECPSCDTKSRIKVKIISNTVTGICPACKNEINHEFNPNKPDLSELAGHLSPRADTRSVIISKLFPVPVHVGGTGELEYHAQVMPAMKNINIEPFLFIKYSSLMYNTPWAERAVPEIVSMEGTPLQDSEMFTRMKELSKKEDADEIAHLAAGIREEIIKRREALDHLQKNLDSKWRTDRDKKARSGALVIAKYMSHAFGTYAKGKTNPEVSWNWIDLALQLNLRDLGNYYQRMSKTTSPLASQLFSSPSRYN